MQTHRCLVCYVRSHTHITVSHMYQVLKLLVMSNRPPTERVHISHTSHMTSVDFSLLNANWTPALPSRLSIFRFKNNALSVFDQPWKFGFCNSRKPKVWLQEILSFPCPGFFIVIVFGSEARSAVTLLSFHLPIPLLQITLTTKIQWNQLPVLPMQFALQIRP